ncbi:LOW QUALITY PROTEIN: transmembrane 6 superfamily member 2b [Trichomycterus rosablanca]|uniref:LOW QUALITY PROTEIN: transmembrane 6 superfamily member 2b n=1 Tax=Trichomycterus rosablanca TaxID=2290929 RepID=UPI002F35CA8A
MVQEICVSFFSWTSLGVLYIMNNVPVFRKPMVIGFAVLVAVFILIYLSTCSNPPKDPLFYVFAEFSFTCIISLISALEYDGFVSGYMEFYQQWGEPYLSASYSIMMCHWEGIVHYFVYLSLIHCMSSRKPYRSLGIFWAGSLLANMVVFLPGIVVGKHASEIHPAYWINLPFLLLPVWGAIRLLQKPREILVVSVSKAEREQRKSLIWRPVDLLFVIYLLGAMVFTIFRGLVTIQRCITLLDTYTLCRFTYLSAVGFPKVMMLLLLFHALPMLGAFVYGLMTPGCTWMLDWTVFTAGAIVQSQWCHVGASLHPHTSKASHFPDSGLVPALLLNLLYATGPLLLSLRCTFKLAMPITEEGLIWVKFLFPVYACVTPASFKHANGTSGCQ